MRCTTDGCAVDVERVECTLNPRTAKREYRAGCGHELTETEARTAWSLGVEIGPVPPIDGTHLIAAERARHTGEEGHTAAADAELVGSELAWACWALIDAALSDRQVEQAPPVWPERLRDRWPGGKSPMRDLIVAGSMLTAEIDRRLKAGETP